MSRRETWRPILEAEVKRWSQLPLEQLIEELHEPQAYEVSEHSKRYQVEVDLLENTDEYVHLCVSVDDGALPWSMFPLSKGILRNKTAGS
jgi:hypothetical protein